VGIAEEVAVQVPGVPPSHPTVDGGFLAGLGAAIAGLGLTLKVLLPLIRKQEGSGGGNRHEHREVLAALDRVELATARLESALRAHDEWERSRYNEEQRRRLQAP
jgi:hypothetical protein